MENMTDSEIREQVKAFLKEKGETQEWLAEQLGLKYQSIRAQMSNVKMSSKTKLALQGLLKPQAINTSASQEKMDAYGIMFTEEEHRLVSEAAKARGMTFGEFMRYAILNPDAK